MLLRVAIRSVTRFVLHRGNIPPWLDQMATTMSDIIPVDDVKWFKTILGSCKMVITVSPNEHGAVSKLYWKGSASLDKETIMIFQKFACFANVILDIGANWGYYTLLSRAFAPSAKIVTFEPHPFWYKKLNENISANRLKNVFSENIAIGKTVGTFSFYIDTKHPSASSMVKAYFRKDETPVESMTNVTTVDKYVLGNDSFAKIDLIKIDVETFEGDVLMGMKAVIERDHPDIICEVLPDEGLDYRNANRKVVHSIISEAGYFSYWISDHGLVQEDEIKGHFPFSNYLFTIKKIPRRGEEFFPLLGVAPS